MRLILSIVFSLLLSHSVFAQLDLAHDNPVVYGHHHVNTSDMAAGQRFWVEGLGGRLSQVGQSPVQAVVFPNVLVFLTPNEPTGETRGSVVNHVGFETTDIAAAVSHLQAMGYAMITREELPPSYIVVNGIGKREGGNTIAFVLGPDGTKVELIENKANSHSIQLHHVHFYSPEGEAMQAWYSEYLLAEKGSRIGQPAGDLPGINLTFAPSEERLAPTRGRALDHIGFEVDGLEAFVAELESKGIEFDRGYTEVPALGIAVAFFTDPWGTYIELSEGLDAVQ